MRNLIPYLTRDVLSDDLAVAINVGWCNIMVSSEQQQYNATVPALINIFTIIKACQL